MGHEYVEMSNTHAAIESYRRACGEYEEWGGTACWIVIDRRVAHLQTSIARTIARGTASDRHTSCSACRPIRCGTFSGRLHSGEPSFQTAARGIRRAEVLVDYCRPFDSRMWQALGQCYARLAK